MTYEQEKLVRSIRRVLYVIVFIELGQLIAGVIGK